MVDQCINSIHIEKLGHKIPEIRERALDNLLSKLNNGVLFDNDLARSKELLNKLMKWFLFEPCSREETVFSLLKRILKSESGQILIEHLGKQSIINELEQIHLYLDPKYLYLLDEVLDIVNNYEAYVVPPLQCNVPLSYRSGESESEFSPYLGTTATVAEGTYRKDSSAEQQAGTQDTTFRYQEIDSASDNDQYFQWQPLVEADRQVLYSVEQSLTDPPQPASLLHSCEFFRDVLLHDFPAEIFLQRPKIVLELLSLLNCGSSRITNAVLYCLLDLMTELQIRVNQCNDMSLKNGKLQHIIKQNFQNSSKEYCLNKDLNIETKNTFETNSEVLELRKNQISPLKYCFLCVNYIFKYLCAKQEEKQKFNKVALSLCLILLEKNLSFLSVYLENQSNIFKTLNDIFISYGLALDHFRIESVSTEDNLRYRGIYLYLLHHTVNVIKKLIPYSKSVTVLPKNLKNALGNSLLDVTFSRLYPTIHNQILILIKKFASDDDKSYLKYEEINKICNGMSSTVKFLKEQKNLCTALKFQLAHDALPSLEFHKDTNYLKIFVDLCAEKYSQICDDSSTTAIVEETTLCLLNHQMLDIKQEMYRLCHKVIITYIGPKLNDNTGIIGSQVQFLLTPKIFVEIACHGLENESYEIQNYATEIFNYILKCKVLVAESIWNKIIRALVTSLPIIACQLSINCNLCKSIIKLVDPDMSKQCGLPTITMLKTNIEFLFLEDPTLRDEALSRICWLLSSQPNSRDLLPGFNTLYDTSLAGICRIKKGLDVNKIRKTDHFYQPSSMQQILEVLNSSDVEPVIKRSALNQISVMMEDVLLHQIFLDANGLKLIVNIMESALTEKNYKNYPDSMLPAVSILKNLCLYHCNVREELSGNEDVFLFVIRGLFLFFTEERLKQDATILLCLLIFKDFIWGSPSRANFSLPKIIVQKVSLPFICNTHWSVSEYTKCSLRDKISTDRWCLSSIQIQWNAEIFGGFERLMKWDEIIYNDCLNTNDLLKLTKYDLKCIKNSSITYCISVFLNNIQNATSHCFVIESLDLLILYINLYKLSAYMQKCNDNDDILKQPWKDTFIRFIKILPSSYEDIMVLKKVLQFLSILVTLYTPSDCWIISFLKDGSQCLLDILTVDHSTDDDMKYAAQELLKLIEICVRQEQHYTDYYPPFDSSGRQTWYHVVKIIADNLKSSGKQHFYNLSYLDSLLSCLVHLTATLGWSESKQGARLKEPIPQMIQNLCELVRAFHSGKGPSAAISVMGLSITRHVILVLNNILAEIKNSKLKDWENCFFDEAESSEHLYSFIALWGSRDIVLRAASLQFFAGLTSTPKAIVQIVHDLKDENGSILEAAIRVLTDYTEAGAVRENAAELITNLTLNATPLVCDKSDNSFVLKKNFTINLLNIIDTSNFYSIIENIFTDLYIINGNYRREKYIENYCSDSEKSYTDDTSIIAVSTPSLVRSVSNLLYNLLWLNPDDLSQKIYELGLVKLIFRTVCNPCMDISNTKSLALYCDILDMDVSVCLLLRRLASSNSSCLGTILHTKDCLNTLVSLLNPQLYQIDLPQLMYLRNQLWTSIFNLLSSIIESTDLMANKCIDVVEIFCGTILDMGYRQFIETICESISNLGSQDLQNSALNFLICLLRIESYRFFTGVDIRTKKSIQNLLDTVKTTRSVVIIDNNKESCTNSESASDSTNKISLLEEIYFGKVFIKPNINENVEVTILENDENGLIAGAEICKILLFIYDLSTLKQTNMYSKKKGLIIKCLSTLLCISEEAKKYALENKLTCCIIKQLRDYHIQLSLESVENLRKASDKKRISPMLKDLDDLVCLMTNFMVDYLHVKNEAATNNLSDVIHKLWVWFIVQSGTGMLINVLKMLCTFTNGCDLACQSLPLTSSIPGSGPKKSTNSSLLHTLISLISRQMELISKTHDLNTLELTFNILHNVCQSSLDCRVLISKSNIFQGLNRLHPAITKRQKPWDSIEVLWLDFLQTFTSHPEGQAAVAKVADHLEVIYSLTNSTKLKNKLLALLVLRNISFHHSNKARLLSSVEFLNMLVTKLSSGSIEEKNIVVVIIWALIANNQKGKNILKGLHLDDKLQNILKHYQLIKNEDIFKNDEVQRLTYVLGILRDDDRIKGSIK